jgi:hypothetical protein
MAGGREMHCFANILATSLHLRKHNLQCDMGANAPAPWRQETHSTQAIHSVCAVLVALGSIHVQAFVRAACGVQACVREVREACGVQACVREVRACLRPTCVHAGGMCDK